MIFCALVQWAVEGTCLSLCPFTYMGIEILYFYLLTTSIRNGENYLHIEFSQATIEQNALGDELIACVILWLDRTHSVQDTLCNWSYPRQRTMCIFPSGKIISPPQMGPFWDLMWAGASNYRGSGYFET